MSPVVRIPPSPSETPCTLKTIPTPTLFDDVDDDTLSEAFDDVDDDPIETYSALASAARQRDSDW